MHAVTLRQIVFAGFYENKAKTPWLGRSGCRARFSAPSSVSSGRHLLKKRRQVEVRHKSRKSNANLAKSPTRTLRIQRDHVFMSIYAVFKLQCLNIKTTINPCERMLQLLINARRSAYVELKKWRATAQGQSVIHSRLQ